MRYVQACLLYKKERQIFYIPFEDSFPAVGIGPERLICSTPGVVAGMCTAGCYLQVGRGNGQLYLSL